MSSLKINFANISLGASVDQQTGNMSVFEILEELRTPQLPVHLQTLCLSISMEKLIPAAVNGKLFIHIITPDNKQAILGSGDMQVPAEQKRMKAVFRFGGFPVMQYGRHRLVVSYVNSQGGKESESLIDFDVIQVQAPPATPTGQNTDGTPPITH